MIDRLRRPLLTYGFYLLIAMLITWPLLSQLGTHLVGFAYGDSREMAHHLWWYKHALQTGQPLFWQPDLGYPDGIEGLLLWADPLQFFPAWLIAFIMPVVAAANLTILLTMALNGWAMQRLARHLLNGREGPALLAGLVFMAAPTFQAHLAGGHAGLMVMWPVPLLVYALLRLRETETRRWFILSVLFFALSSGGHGIQTIYVLLPLVAVILLMRLWQRDWIGLRQTILVSFLGGVLVLAFLLPLALAATTTAAYRDEGGFVRYSADLLSIVSPSFFHPLYSQLAYPARVLGVNLEEGSSYIGIVAGLLVLLALWRRRAGSMAAGWWGLLLLVAWVCSLGPLLKVFDLPLLVHIDGYETAITLPWAFVQDLPLFSLARTPGRFNFTMALAVAMLAGYGTDWLWQRVSRLRWRPLLLTGLMALILFDTQWYWPLPTTSAAIPQAVYDLAGRDDIRAVLDLPWDSTLAAKEGLYLRTAHQLPLIAGHITRSTPVSPAKLSLLQATLDPALLRSVGADLVIWHKRHTDAETLAFAREQLGNPIFEDDAFAIYKMPETSATPGFEALLTDQTQIERSADSYVFAPESSWVDLSGTMIADGRVVELYLDDRLSQRWIVDGALDLNVPLPLLAGEFHTVTLALNPPCPAEYSPTLACRGLTLRDVHLGAYQPGELQVVQFDRGVRLRGGGVELDGQTMVARLWWFFSDARQETDIRFVHVIDESGALVAQDDDSPGLLSPETGWVERVAINLPEDLPAGSYRVYTGWYHYPDLTRFDVLSGIDGAEDDLVLIGSFVYDGN